MLQNTTSVVILWRIFDRVLLLFWYCSWDIWMGRHTRTSSEHFQMFHKNSRIPDATPPLFEAVFNNQWLPIGTTDHPVLFSSIYTSSDNNDCDIRRNSNVNEEVDEDSSSNDNSSSNKFHITLNDTRFESPTSNPSPSKTLKLKVPNLWNIRINHL